MAAFHAAGGVRNFYEANHDGEEARHRMIDMRIALLKEECLKELISELLDFRAGEGDLCKLAKEVADVLYVTYAIADLFGFDAQSVYEAVHKSNMTKVDETGRIQRNAVGKILKGPNYQPPDLFPIVIGEIG